MRDSLAMVYRGCLLLAMLLSGSMFRSVTAQTTLPVATAEATLTPVGIAPVEGRVVRSMRLLSSSGQQSDLPQSLLDSIAQKAGAPFDRAKLRSSVQALYLTGMFADIEVKADTDPDGGLNLAFVTVPSFFTGEVRVQGLPKGNPTETQMVNATALTLGEAFSERKLQDSVERMQRVLEDNGYYRARVSAERVPHPETQQMDVVFTVVPGPVAHVRKISVTGDSDLSARDLEHIGPLRPGAVVRGDSVSVLLSRLRKHFTRQDRLEAQMALTAHTYNPSSNTVDYIFDLKSGPVIDISTDGVQLSRGQLRKYVPVFEENAVDDDLLNEGRRNLRDYFQTQGYFDAEITVRQVPEGNDKLHIVFHIDRGQRRKLTAIEIEGNKAVLADNIRQLLVMQPSSLLFRNGRFSQSILNRDIATVRSFYTSNGYRKVEVSGEVLHDGKGGARDDFRVILHIKEGPLVKVHSLAIAGNKLFTTDEIRSWIDLAEGQPYSDTTIAGDHDAIVSAYYNSGFPSVQMETSVQPQEGDENSMDVAYTVREGDRVFVDRVLVSGVEKTKPDIVQRQLKISDHAPLSQGALLDSQRGLYDLGIFNEVDVAVQNPEGAATHKNVLFNIKEAKRYTFNYGLGIEAGSGVNQSKNSGPQGQIGVSPRISFDVTRINFRGRDQSIIFKSHFGNLQKRALISFDEPHWFELNNWRLTLTAFYDNTRNVNTFASQRTEGSVQLQQVVTKATQMLYSFAYRLVKVDPNSFPAGFTADLIPLYSQPVRVGMPSTTYVRDTRDNPVSSTKGTYNTADVGIASGYFGSEANFARVSFLNSTYHGFGKKKNIVLARSTHIGVESPYSNSTFVPLPERFFVGGANSLRGFPMNQAGPRDLSSGSPLGGNAMFVNNIELRLPPAQLPFVNDNLSFAFFHDMGNAFSSTRDMFKSLGTWHQPNQDSCRDLSSSGACNFNYISHAVGAGIRYRTPIGPVRVDIGYNLNPPLFPVKQPSDGSTPYYDRVRRINFYFSIGQTF